jgi:hypothetical protein
VLLLLKSVFSAAPEAVSFLSQLQRSFVGILRFAKVPLPQDDSGNLLGHESRLLSVVWTGHLTVRMPGFHEDKLRVVGRRLDTRDDWLY